MSKRKREDVSDASEEYPDVVTVSEASRLLGVSESSMRRNKWGLRIFRVKGLTRKFYREDIMRLKNEAVQTAT